MSKLFPAAALATLATVAQIAFLAVPTEVRAAEAVGVQATAVSASATAVQATAGKPLFDAKGARIGAVYSVAADGAARLILNGKMVTVPVATLSQADGKLVTSLTRSELLSAR